MSTQQRIRQFVLENFYVSDPKELADDTSLVSGGYVDSTGMLEVISFLESEFRIRVAEHETTPENLESIAKIASFVAKKQGAAAAS